MKTDTKKLKDTVMDKSLSVDARKNAALLLKEKLLNPLNVDVFDPKTFDPNSESEITKLIPRKRIVPLRRLPTMGMKPKEIMEGQMIGMLESKQDLYLLIAWLSERVSDLEDLVENITKEKPAK